MIKNRRMVGLFFLFCLLVGIIAACGGGEEAAPAATSQPVATMPPARFTAVAEQSAAQATSVAPRVETLVTPTVDVSISRGETVYTNRKCADCHGAQGEGVASKEGGPLSGTQLTFQEFETLMRTGGQGSLGPDHLYGPSTISPSGMNNLYAYIKSLETK